MNISLLEKMRISAEVGTEITIMHEPDGEWYRGKVEEITDDMLALSGTEIKGGYEFSTDDPEKFTRTTYFEIENIIAFGVIRRCV